MSESLAQPAELDLHAPAAAAAALSANDRLAAAAGPVLRGVAKGLHCERGGFQASELWLLDDASRTLRLTARWAADGSSLAAAPEITRRFLANAPADVAALAGGAVVLEDPSEAAGWDLHAPAAGAAICLPVSSDTTIHGVMWLLRDGPLAISDEALELGEVVAGRLALEVERMADGGWRMADSAARTTTPEANLAAAPNEESAALDESVADTDSAIRNPHSAIVLPVEAAAWTAPVANGLSAASCWELPDRWLLSLAAAAIDSPESSTATQRSAIEWLMEEAPLVAARADDAGQLLTWLNRRLIESPLAGEGLAVAAALIEAPEDAAAGLGGVGTWAFAGPTIALSIRAAATESHAGDLVPLGWSEPEAAYAPRPFELAIRERLVLTAGDPRLTSPLVERRLGDIYRAATADAHREMTAEAALRRLVASGSDDVLAAVCLRRG